MKKEKKRKKKKAMLVFMLYTSWLTLYSHYLEIKRTSSGFGFFGRSSKRTGGSRKGPGPGGVREPALSVAVTDCMSETDLRFLRSAAVLI